MDCKQKCQNDAISQNKLLVKRCSNQITGQKLQQFQQKFCLNIQQPKLSISKNLSAQLLKDCKKLTTNSANIDQNSIDNSQFEQINSSDSIATTTTALCEDAQSSNYHLKIKKQKSIFFKSGYIFDSSNLISSGVNTNKDEYFVSQVFDTESFKQKMQNDNTDCKMPQQQLQINNEEDDNFSSVDILDQSEINQNTEFNKNYAILEHLGNGIQAKVTKCVCLKTGKIVAAKTFRIVDDEIKNQIEKEFEIMRQLNHPDIVKVYDLIDQDQQPTIIMEYFDGENLQNTDLYSMSTNEKCNLIKELLNIISYIHEQKIIHRDLQLKNILYNANTKQLKLIDFGIAKKEIENNLNISQVGFRHYQAPEMLDGQIYTCKVDIWQIGQIFYEIMEEVKIHSRKLSNLISKNQLEFNKSNLQIKNFILSLLNLDCKQRLNAKDAYNTLKNICNQN